VRPTPGAGAAPTPSGRPLPGRWNPRRPAPPRPPPTQPRVTARSFSSATSGPGPERGAPFWRPCPPPRMAGRLLWLPPPVHTPPSPPACGAPGASCGPTPCPGCVATRSSPSRGSGFFFSPLFYSTTPPLVVPRRFPFSPTPRGPPRSCRVTLRPLLRTETRACGGPRLWPLGPANARRPAGAPPPHSAGHCGLCARGG